MRLAWILAPVLAAGIAGCGGEPTYRGINFIVYNYTPWDLDQVRVTDASGRSAVTGAIGVGGGEGSVSCCYTLKGTEFKVTWRGADAEEARRHMFDGKLDEVIFEKTAPVHFPVSEIPAGEGPLYLELHIYPDEHMELALSRKLLGQTRIPIVAVTRWLYTEHRDALANYGSSSEVRRVLGKVAGTAWKKYRIEAEVDMRQYMRLYFTVASDFDTDPEIAALLSQPGRQPGDFAKAVAALPVATIARLKAQGTPPGDKNG